MRKLTAPACMHEFLAKRIQGSHGAQAYRGIRTRELLGCPGVKVLILVAAVRNMRTIPSDEKENH